jgi:hypothetical protein
MSSTSTAFGRKMKKSKFRSDMGLSQPKLMPRPSIKEFSDESLKK